MKLNVCLTGFGSILFRQHMNSVLDSWHLLWPKKKKRQKQKKIGWTHSICLWSIAFTPFSSCWEWDKNSGNAEDSRIRKVQMQMDIINCSSDLLWSSVAICRGWINSICIAPFSYLGHPNAGLTIKITFTNLKCDLHKLRIAHSCRRSHD